MDFGVAAANFFGGILCLALGLVVQTGKANFLIAGYNTMSEEERAKWDAKAMSGFIGRVVLALPSAVLLAACAPILLGFFPVVALIASWALFAAIMIAGLIYVNLSPRFKISIGAAVMAIFALASCATDDPASNGREQPAAATADINREAAVTVVVDTADTGREATVTADAGREAAITVDIGSGVVMEMAWIAPGSFTMGQNDDMPYWSPAPERMVTLTGGFFMGAREVTQEQYYAVMGYNPSRFSGSPAAGEAQPRRPVERVSWYHAIAFANRLSILQGLEPVYSVQGVSNTDPDAWLHSRVPTERNAAWDAVTADWNASGFRLPTEAEWEYAARAGTATRWSFGDDAASLGDYAWYSGNSESRTRETGGRAPNAWGLYDMHGNVWEWVWDWWGTPEAALATDPKGADSGGFRVVRGGSWFSPPEGSRSAIRSDGIPGYGSDNLGFRVARN